MEVMALCPPCSGSGRRRELRNNYEMKDISECPLCVGAGELPASVEEAFWGCVTVAVEKQERYRVPWICAEETSWR